MKDRIEICFAGSGGQGVILSSIILAEAALEESFFAAQSQSYGPEARGGVCKADIVIDRIEIDYPRVNRADFLLALTQSALDKYAPGVREGGIIMADSSLKAPGNIKDCKIMFIPILETAVKTIGKAMSANIVALGAIRVSSR